LSGLCHLLGSKAKPKQSSCLGGMEGKNEGEEEAS